MATSLYQQRIKEENVSTNMSLFSSEKWVPRHSFDSREKNETNKCGGVVLLLSFVALQGNVNPADKGELRHFHLLWKQHYCWKSQKEQANTQWNAGKAPANPLSLQSPPSLPHFCCVSGLCGFAVNWIQIVSSQLKAFLSLASPVYAVEVSTANTTRKQTVVVPVRKTVKNGCHLKINALEMMSSYCALDGGQLLERTCPSCWECITILLSQLGVCTQNTDIMGINNEAHWNTHLKEI